MPVECSHGRTALIATAARIAAERGYRWGSIEWCCDCGAVRSLVDTERGDWLSPRSSEAARRLQIVGQVRHG